MCFFAHALCGVRTVGEPDRAVVEENFMKTLMMTLAAAVLVVPMTVGCSRTVAHEENTSRNPITGTATHQEKTVVEHPDGSYSTEQQTEKMR